MTTAPPSQLLAHHSPRGEAHDPALDAVLARVLDEALVPTPAVRRPVGRRLVLVGGVATLTAAAVALPAVLRREDATVQALERLAERAAAQPVAAFGPGRFLRLVVVENPDGGGVLITGEPAPQGAYPRTLESWTAADGTIWRRDTEGGGARRFHEFLVTELVAGGPMMTPAGLASLPTDPARLERLLRPDRNATDESVFHLALRVLGTGFAPPALRRTLFDVLARLPDVATTRVPTTDGRPSLRVTHTGPDRGGRSQYACFDEDTAEVLETGDVIDGVPTFVSVVQERRFVDAVPAEVLERSAGTPQG